MTAQLSGIERREALYRELLPQLRSPSGDPHREKSYPTGDGRIWSFCPAHPDGTKHHNRSLSLSTKYGVECFAGCEFTAIIDGFNLPHQRPTETERVVPIRQTRRPASASYGEPRHLYVYRDSSGVIVGEKGRWEQDGNKTFRWRKPGGTWQAGIAPLKVNDMPLWGADLVMAAPADQRVFLVEGEKATEACRARGLLTVTCAGGASTTEFGTALDVLRGRVVILWPDNDAVGKGLMQRVAAHLRGLATASLTIAPGGPDKGDAFEYFSGGGTVEELEQMIARGGIEASENRLSEYHIDQDGVISATRPIDETLTLGFHAENLRQERTGVHARVSLTCNGADLAWSNFNVERDEDRVRLVNSAVKALPAAFKGAYDDKILKTDLDRFCRGLWDAQIEDMMPSMVGGTLEPTAPSFLLYPFVLAEGGTIIFAPPGRGKSYTLLLMAVCLDAGSEVLWLPVKRSKVLFINLERGARSVADRLGNVNAALGLRRDRPIPMINRRGRTLADVAQAAIRHIRKYGTEVVFVDSISRAGSGDLNENNVVNKIIDQLNAMCPAWVGLAHTPRSDESHLYGGVHFEAGADIVACLLSQQEDDGPLGIGLQITKQNDVGRTPQWLMRLDFNGFGLSSVRPARPGEFTEIESGARKTNKEQIREYLADADTSRCSATEIGKELGLPRHEVARILNGDPLLFVKLEKRGREQIFGLLASEVGA
jgi:hypothetical protein